MNHLTPTEVDEIYLARLHRRSEAWNELKWAKHVVLSKFAKFVVIEEAGSRHREEAWVRQDSKLPHRVTKEQAVADAVTFEELAAQHADSDAVRAAGAAEEAFAEANLAVRECEDEYASRPWSRYWLVCSSDGHVHRSCDCSTCNKGRSPTQFALTPYLSGQTVEAAVADLGPALCSVCFPEAPVESREQARISARLAIALAEGGSEAFQKARKEAQEAAEARAASRCPGSGQHGERCPVCGYRGRSARGKVLPHKQVRYAVEADFGREWWTGAGWGKRKDRVLFDTREQAQAVAAGREGAQARTA